MRTKRILFALAVLAALVAVPARARADSPADGAYGAYDAPALEIVEPALPAPAHARHAHSQERAEEATPALDPDTLTHSALIGNEYYLYLPASVEATIGEYERSPYAAEEASAVANGYDVYFIGQGFVYWPAGDRGALRKTTRPTSPETSLCSSRLRKETATCARQYPDSP